MAYDVAIVGAGPGGSTLAYRLAKLGVDVLLMDKATFPRKKPCGGACDGLFFKHLPEGMSIEPVIEAWCRKATIAYKDQFSETFDLVPPLAMTQRSNLDTCLVRQASEAGAKLLENTGIKHISVGSDSYQLIGQGAFSARARVVVGADGAYSTVARSLDYNIPRQQYIVSELDLPRVGQLEQPMDWAVLDLSVKPLAYWWQFPKADHINVGFGVPRPIAQLLSSPDLLQSYAARWGLTLSGKDWGRRVSHMVPFARRGYQVTKGPSLLIGDAAGLIDPNTGAGISWAVASGQWAKDTIISYLRQNPYKEPPNFKSYEKMHQLTLREFEAGEALRNILAFSLIVRDYDLARQCIKETISYPTGHRSYQDWAKDHPGLNAVGRLIQRFVVNRTFQSI